jgi:hypothetical protein
MNMEENCKDYTKYNLWNDIMQVKYTLLIDDLTYQTNLYNWLYNIENEKNYIKKLDELK